MEDHCGEEEGTVVKMLRLEAGLPAGDSWTILRYLCGLGRVGSSTEWIKGQYQLESITEGLLSILVRVSIAATKHHGQKASLVY